MPRRQKELRLSELNPVEVVRLVVPVPEHELRGHRFHAHEDGFDNVADWYAWLARARSKGMLLYTPDAGHP